MTLNRFGRLVTVACILCILTEARGEPPKTETPRGDELGACCNPATGVCLDDVHSSHCLPPMVFAAKEDCSAAFPDCGNPGACCDDFTGDCNEDVLELDCDGTRFAPAPATCSDFDHGCGNIYASFRLGVGTEPPPAMLCGWYFMSFPDDPRPTFCDVSDVPWIPPHSSHSITFTQCLSHRKIGDGWMNWSHGYTGDVYYSNGATEVTLNMPVFGS